MRSSSRSLKPMARGRRTLGAIVALTACVLAVALPVRLGFAGWPSSPWGVVLAQASSVYDLSWNVVAGGGGRVESAGHTLLSTIGQPAAGPVAGPSYTLRSGFWGGALVDEGHRVYLPLVMKGPP